MVLIGGSESSADVRDHVMWGDMPRGPDGMGRGRASATAHVWLWGATPQGLMVVVWRLLPWGDHYS